MSRELTPLMKRLLPIIACLVTTVGCTHRPIKGAWTGPLRAVTTFDQHGREHVVAGFDAERGTRIDEPYAVAGVAYAILVDEQYRAYPPDAFRHEPGAAVRVKGTMKRANVRAMDCGAFLGSRAYVGARSSGAGGLVVVVKHANVRRADE